jgi:hypothetical protein
MVARASLSWQVAPPPRDELAFQKIYAPPFSLIQCNLMKENMECQYRRSCVLKLTWRQRGNVYHTGDSKAALCQSSGFHWNSIVVRRGP